MSADIDGVSDAGAVYIYKLEDNGTTTYVSKISAADKATDDNFGVGVSISQNILFVGASSADVDGVYGSGAVYMYELKDTDLVP